MTLPPSIWNAIRADIPEFTRYDGLNAEWHIDSYDSNTDSFALSSASLGDYTNSDVRWSDKAIDQHQARFVLAKAVPSSKVDSIGPFIFDLGQPFAIGGNNLVLFQEIQAGASYSTLKVTANALSINPGWLLFNYGYESQTGPVRVLGALDDQTLMIDSGFKFLHYLGYGSKVNLLYQRAAFEPDSPIGSAWLTASNAGRIAAINLLKDISAAGIELNIATRYPGDTSLGGAGFPTFDNYKLSDIVECLGGDDLDSELEELRSGNF